MGILNKLGYKRNARFNHDNLVLPMALARERGISPTYLGGSTYLHSPSLMAGLIRRSDAIKSGKITRQGILPDEQEFVDKIEFGLIDSYVKTTGEAFCVINEPIGSADMADWQVYLFPGNSKYIQRTPSVRPYEIGTARREEPETYRVTNFTLNGRPISTIESWRVINFKPSATSEHIALVALGRLEVMLLRGVDAHLRNAPTGKNIISLGGESFADISPELRDSSVDEFIEELTGYDKSGGTIATAFEVAATKLGTSMRDIDTLHLPSGIKQRIAALLSVPVVLLDDQSQSTYNNVREARISFFRNTVEQAWSMYSSQLSEGLTRYAVFSGRNTVTAPNAYEFDTTGLRAYEPTPEEINATIQLVGAGVLTTDEARRRLRIVE